MKNLTVIILASNEEDVIGDAIKSCKGFAEKIVVVDSNSEDRTVNIAESLGAEVVRHTLKNFSEQRNYAILHATTKWVLYLDADERLTDEFKEEVEKLVAGFEQDSEFGGYCVRRKTYYYGQDWGYVDQVQRLFLREKFDKWEGVVHETPKIKGEFGIINSPILHFTHRNLSQMIRKTNEWSDYEARLRFDSKHPKLVHWRFFRVMVTEFFNSYIKNKGYKNGTYGLIEAIYQSFSIFITYAKLWELQRKKSSDQTSL